MVALFFFYGGAGFLGQTNKGMLVTPVLPTDDLKLKAYDNKPATFQKKWTVLYRVTACDKHCERVMDKLLRARLALGKDMARTEAKLLSAEKVSPALLKIMKDVRGLDTGALLIDNRSKLALDTHTIFIVDPFGNIMMRYPDNSPPKDIHSDLVRLLKVSNIG
jgi:hypothetical protein